MRLRLLGTAAGGGFPQWNCGCAFCALARSGRVPRRTQSSIAVSAGDGPWALINASPDFPAQAERIARGSRSGSRGSPVDAVYLTNADLDHVLGLAAMREGPPLRVHATPVVRQTLTEAWPLDQLLQAFCGVEWHELTTLAATLQGSIDVRAHFLPGGPPPYARGMVAAGTGHSLALELHDHATGGRAVIAPDVACVTEELQAALERADAILFDGTFWRDDELQRIKPGGRTSREMGHLPIHDGSLDLLRPLKAARKSYLHINNTNPILDPNSPERAAVAAAGLLVEEDGTEWIL